MAKSLDRADLSYTATSDGYTIHYKGLPVGGAGVELPRKKRLHWRHARANLAMFTEQAKSQIDAIVDGRGEPRFLKVIASLDSEAQ